MRKSSSSWSTNGFSVCGSCAQPVRRIFLAGVDCAPAGAAKTASASAVISPVRTEPLPLMMVPPRTTWPCGHLLDELADLLHGGGEQRLALGARGDCRIAHDAGLGQSRPVRPHRQRAVGPVEPGVLGVPVGDLLDRLVHLYELRPQREIDR